MREVLVLSVLYSQRPVPGSHTADLVLVDPEIPQSEQTGGKTKQHGVTGRRPAAACDTDTVTGL